MFLLLIICLLPITILGVYLFISNNKNGEFFSHRHLPITSTLIAILPVLFACLFTFITIPQNYNGLCESPPDVSQACSFFEYIIFNISPNAGWNFFGYLVLIPLEITWASAVFGLSAFYARHIK